MAIWECLGASDVTIGGFWGKVLIVEKMLQWRQVWSEVRNIVHRVSEGQERWEKEKLWNYEGKLETRDDVS